MTTIPNLVTVEALAAFTVTRPYGQFHGDPLSQRNRICKVPADDVADLADRGLIRLIEDDQPTQEPSQTAQQEPDQAPPVSDDAPPSSVGVDMQALRERYETAVGKRPFMGWDAATLLEKIAAASQPESEEGTVVEDDGPPV